MAARGKTDKKKSKLPGAAELRALSVEDLRKSLAERQEELMSARFKHATATLEDTASLKTLRRQIGRIQTILHEKEQRVQHVGS